MRITIRLIVSLACVVAAVAAISAFLQVGQERQRQADELERRARLVAQSLLETFDSLDRAAVAPKLRRLSERFDHRGRVTGVAFFGADGEVIVASPWMSSGLPEASDFARGAIANRMEQTQFKRVEATESLLYMLPLEAPSAGVAAVLVVHDASHVSGLLRRIWRYAFLRVLAQMLLISLVTLMIVRWSIVGPIAKTAEWMRHMRTGGGTGALSLPKEDLFAPLAKEVSTFAHHLIAAQRSAEEQAKFSEQAESFWSPERLKEHVRVKLGGKSLFVVSNREPYMHVRAGKKLETIIPAAGLVTALDPVMRACGGTWIAHGAGDGDWSVVDKHDRVRVPEGDPRYLLRRVPLSKQEEDGYYYGFSNQGLWPLCLMTHQRPVFRESDWLQYQAVNKKFAEVTLRELAGVEDPCVLIQDYQFALLPRLIKQERPDARVAIFWHIPWPNSEAFSICPWQREILYGILGADLAGFHTQLFCNNFIETVDRALESRVRWESFSVEKEGHRTMVKPFPVGVCFPQVFPDVAIDAGASVPKSELLRDLGVKASRLGIGVERIDYTKGLLERFLAIERFFEKYPLYVGEFSFVEFGAPSRTHIKSYHDFMAHVEAEVDRINWKFNRKDWRPIVLLLRHHAHKDILPFYRAADVCMVTSLHDGMNLVAKEFVAARSEETGALILSRFAGASAELRDALIVNPYDIERMADAICAALEMPKEEQVLRMRRMRQSVSEHNIYRWGASLVAELAKLRLAAAAAEESHG
ncbi:MAG TPA: trehalose-6-phosphate synthase [Elusimicrobia bacterium]|nr:trehalose-6-phosphate synthase [Elusimicrobiota bacterium]HBT62891.1 trehalose-6-phosphate synthase [Elusimicrobiota bacterium]